MVGEESQDRMALNHKQEDDKENLKNRTSKHGESENKQKTVLTENGINRNYKSTEINNNISLNFKEQRHSVTTPNSKSQRQSFSLPVTPKKCIPSFTDDPLTPTANLKMLVSAAFSVAGKTEGKEKRDLFQNDDDFQEDSCSTVSDSIEDKDKNCDNDEFDIPFDYGAGGSRKFKSLGLLCQKFLQRYPDHVEGQEINLHEVAKELQVERRRIYDIVNVLESLEYVTKKGKNTYVWHGSKRLIPTLCKLKALAFKIYSNKGGDSQFAEIPNFKVPQVWLRNGIMISEQDENDLNYVSTLKKEEESKKRKNKSLGIFCQKLLMLFMVSKDQTVALEKAAREVIEVTEDPLGKNKTKVRRLYDIANILTSMQLIEKTVVFSGSRKTAFKWIGIDLNTLQPDTEALDRTLSGVDAFAATKHSLFSQPTALADFKLGSKSIRKLGARSMSASQLVPKRNKMPRTKSAATISRKRSSAEILTTNYNYSLAGSMESLCSPNYETNEGNEIAKMVEESIFKMPVKDLYNDTESPAKSCDLPCDHVSPKEREFREAISRLKERFPQKIQNTDGILDLLTACKQGGVSCDKDGNISELTEKHSRCCLLNRMSSDEPTAKKSRESFNHSCNHNSISGGLNESTESLVNRNGINSKQGLVVQEYNGNVYTNKESLPTINSVSISTQSHLKIGKTPSSYVQTVSVGVQTDSSPLKHCQSSPTVPNGHCITPISIQSAPNASSSSTSESMKSVIEKALSNDETVTTKRCYMLGIKQNCLNHQASNQASQKLKALQPSTLQNIQRKENLIHIIKIPNSSLPVLPKNIFVSEKENFPALGYDVVPVSIGNAKATRDNVAKTPLPILPKKNTDNTSEETPDRGNIPLNCTAVKTQRKLSTLNSVDS